MYWQGFEPAKLLDNARLVSCLRDLPYQVGRPLSTIEEEESGDVALVDYSTTHSTPDLQVYVSVHGEDSDLGSQAGRYANDNLDQVSDDELSVNAPQGESPQEKDARHLRNHRQNIRRRNATAREQRAPTQNPGACNLE